MTETSYIAIFKYFFFYIFDLVGEGFDDNSIYADKPTEVDKLINVTIKKAKIMEKKVSYQ
jgi:hypothetical protein